MTLRDLPARTIVRAIAGAAQRWANASFPPRAAAIGAIVERTGYAVPAVEYALDRIFSSMTHRALEATIASELGCIEALDGFAPRSGRPAAWARAIGSACVISSRTTIGVALVPAVFALCAKCDVLVKDREDHLVAAFFETLREEHDAFAAAARAQAWSSADEAAFDLAPFGAVVAFGRTETLARIRERCHPEARFVGYGSRTSAGYVAADWLRDEAAALVLAEGAARDLVLYDSEGCLSLHALFVERGARRSPYDFARLLAGAVERAAIEFPVGRFDAGAAAARGAARNLAAFRAAAGTGAVFADETCTYAIVLDPPRDEPPPFLPRTLVVLPVDGPSEALAYLRRHALPLEGFALSGERADLLSLAVDAGAVRLTRFGELQQPRLGVDHGGLSRIAEFIRWIDNDF